VLTGRGVNGTVLVSYNDDLYRPKTDRDPASIKVNPPGPGAVGDVSPPPTTSRGPTAQESGAVPEGNGGPGTGVDPGKGIDGCTEALNLETAVDRFSMFPTV
jgi:hypothetical protein